MRLLPAFALLLFALPAHSVVFDWIEIGDAGNGCDVQSFGCFGAMDHVYRISKYEVTNAEYTEFLNAVAATDTYALYNAGMATVMGAITQSGPSGAFTYTVEEGFEDRPVNFVSFYDALRFANWLHSGQPTGAQDNSTTEDGAYTITPEGIAANSIVRDSGATIFLPTRDEWYKAAYYDAFSLSYFDYPAGTDTPTTCTMPGPTPNTANCSVVGTTTDVGAYTGSPSPYGTFDQGGNVYEWNETIIDGTNRGVRGGSWHDGPGDLEASGQGGRAANPVSESEHYGFRVATILDDTDADGILDIEDNCIDVENSDQLDTDADLYGNACDCDFDQSESCNISDFNIFLPDFASGTDSGLGTDMDSNGTVGIDDFNLFLPGFIAGEPGPSGLVP